MNYQKFHNQAYRCENNNSIGLIIIVHLFSRCYRFLSFIVKCLENTHNPYLLEFKRVLVSLTTKEFTHSLPCIEQHQHMLIRQTPLICVCTYTCWHTHRQVCYSHTPNSMWHGREDQCVNTTKPGWWPPRGMTRWEILSAWPLIPVLETRPCGEESENGSKEMERQERLGEKKSDGKKYREGE